MTAQEVTKAVQDLMENATALAVAVSMAAPSIGAIIATVLKAWHSLRSQASALKTVIEAIEWTKADDVKFAVDEMKQKISPGARAALDKAVKKADPK